MSCAYPKMALAKKDHEGKWRMSFVTDLSREQFDALPDSSDFVGGYERKMLIPCGNCLSCRIAYGREWTIRNCLEMKSFRPDECWFVTLTYDNDHLPEPSVVPAHPDDLRCDVDLETGELINAIPSCRSSLVKRDFELFMKRLRIAYVRDFHECPDDYRFPSCYEVVDDSISTDSLQKSDVNPCIRFFMCGEYGEKYHRPHYHVLFYGLQLPDLVCECKNYRGDCYYSSDFLTKLWGKGFVTVGSVSWDSVSYVCRYILKKQKGFGAVEEYQYQGIIPPFVQMSRRPGIAREYFDLHKDDIYAYDQVVLTGSDGRARRVKPAKYFDRLYSFENPDFMESLKEKRQGIAKRAMLRELEHTDLDACSYLIMKDEAADASLKRFLRDYDCKI